MPFWINILVGLLAFIVAALGGKALLPWLHKIKFGQPIKVDFGPKWHANKQGTPTMGGILFIVGSVVGTAAGYALFRFLGTLDATTIAGDREALRVMSCVIFCILFGVIGFIDDFAKVAKKQNEGLKPMQKIVLQVVAAVLWLAAMYWFGDRSTVIDLSFVNFDISFFYYPLMILVILYLTNAVNLTDGVDGLCGTVTLVAMLIFTLICSKLQMETYTLFTMALAGGCLGFLVWNLHPAKCFMGDTGSMYLGAAVTAVGLATHKHLVLLLVALVYILEALSVMIQVTYFKYTKKKYGEGRRIFKMTPIHHHFEMSGFSEYKIVLTFSLFGLIVGLCGLLLVVFA
ncbi:phospho-N-acetylmuramoyl-pentapeptide-transferase [uncultured Ruminococcus sp.]|uniref:phospho-N-acetylmuramoyl-pentapeptide- transferase n=1 Tax=uncultured Ruminococcus sp. TaxID=165186 RepID=UPI0025E75A36|nr:phospho-N-acetylmuramoyl-pentapeptide-transferase [uncultured Ruminococcus sp.]